MEEKKKSHRQMARELDQMPKDVTSEEAEFLEEVMDAFGEGKKLKPKMATQLEELHQKYLGVQDLDEEVSADEGTDEEPDEEDFE